MTHQIPLERSKPIESWGASIAAGIFFAAFLATVIVVF